jgi:pimeloyl-ACP methyl ester carboxylesterase
VNKFNLLLVHGALGTADQLAPLVPLLEDRIDLHQVELEGHGGTPSDALHYSMDQFAANLRVAIAEKGIAPAAIFGYSMGGYAALKLAEDDPSMVSHVITLGTKLAWSPEVAARETAKLDPSKIKSKVPAFAEELERRHASLPGGWESVVTKTAALMSELGERPGIDDSTLARIQQPVRLMVGDRDNVVTIEETVAASRAMSRGGVAVLPGTPHPFEQVRTGLVAALIRDFFDRH